MFAAGISALGSVAGSALDYFGQKSTNRSNRRIATDTNAASAHQAALQRDFQERMSNTSWQRGVADMKKAGINPMLAFSQGGASSPIGSSASMTTGAPMQNPSSGFASRGASAVASAIDAYRSVAETQNVIAQNRQIAANTLLTNARTANTLQDNSLKVATARSALAQAKIREADLPIHSLEGSAAGLSSRVLGKATSHVGSIISTAKQGRSLLDMLRSKPFSNRHWGVWNKSTGEIHR